MYVLYLQKVIGKYDILNIKPLLQNIRLLAVEKANYFPGIYKKPLADKSNLTKHDDLHIKLNHIDVERIVYKSHVNIL